MADTQQKAANDGLINDQETLAVKQNLMGRMRRGAMLNSVSSMGTFLAGIMLSVSMSMIVPAIGVASATHAGLGLLSAVVAASPMGVAFLGIAAVATIAAVGSNYMASRIFQGSNFDQTDFNARDTAKCLVQKLKENNMSMPNQDHEQNQRADGKSWAQVVRQQNQPTLAQQT